MSLLSDQHCQPSDLLRFCARFPDAEFIGGYSGFSNWRAFGSAPPPNLWFDISAWQEPLAGDGEGLKAELRQLLAHFPGRVFFGTDSPFYGFNPAFCEAKRIAVVRECAEQVGAESARSVFSETVLAPHPRDRGTAGRAPGAERK
jgi:predicted TIM-barrel fold metal-dependent hydrolase